MNQNKISLAKKTLQYLEKKKLKDINLKNFLSKTKVPNMNNKIDLILNVNDILDFQLKKNLYIYDLVYKPSQTNLLKEAEINNLNYQNGLAMLVHQAAESFRIWHGVYPEITNELFEILKS